ncbi:MULTISPECIES: hypothetical protein [Streptomyces]|uniref:Uncharacterized protein n=1 Tax=Streptomyces galilaeus TaxID=33899 RepID=A0ABW9IKZ1_STRGJ
MLNRPAAEHAELQEPSADLEVKAARRKWNPALHPRDSKGRFIETGGTVRLWGGKLARVVRALPNDRILVQDQTGPNEFRGRRHTTSAKWVSMVSRPDGTAPTEDEDKVVQEDEKRTRDPRRGNGHATDDDGDPDTPNDPHDVDDQGRPIGDDDGDGPDDDDDQGEDVDISRLPNRPINRVGGNRRFEDIAAVRRHFLQLADRPGQNPDMAAFLRSLALKKDLQATANGKLVALRDDGTRRWYLTAIGTGQRMTGAGDFEDSNEASSFASHLDSAARRGEGQDSWPFDFTDPNLDEVARTWRSNAGENIQAAILRARADFDAERKHPAAKKTAAPKATRTAPTPAPAPTDAPNNGGSPSTVNRDALKPGDRIKVTVSGSDIEWPASTRNQDKPETVTVEGTVAPTFSGGPSTQGAPLVDVTLTGPDGIVMVSGDTAHVRRMPGQVAVSGHTDGYTPEEIRADRVRAGDVIVRGQFGHVVGRIDRFAGGRTFTTRNLGGLGEIDQFGMRPGDMLSVIPKARRRPEDVLRDVPDRAQQHPNSTDAKRAATGILSDWGKVNELAEQQWPDGAPTEFRVLAQHMQNVTDTPKGADGYQQNAHEMRGALAALHELDTQGVDHDLVRALHRLEEGLDDNADRFEADSRAIKEKKRKREDEATVQKPAADAPEADDTGDSGEESPSGSGSSGEREPYDPSFQQQTDENGRITHYRTPQGVSRDIGGRFGVGEPVHNQHRENYIVVSGNDDGTVNVRRQPLYDDAPLGRPETIPADELRTNDGFRPWRPEAAQAAADESAPSPDDPGVTLSPDEVNAPAAATRAVKAPSAMDDGELRDEIVSLMEREMENGGELSGVDRTRLRVLEAEEARRAGRKPKEEPKPKPKAPAEEPGGLFDVGQDEAQPMFADPNNPYDQPDDPTGTPDMFAAAEGRDTSKLRPVQARKPMDFQRGDRFVDADGRTHTVAEEPIRTPRGRIRVVTEGGREHFLAADNELRVLHADEDAPELPETDASKTTVSGADVPEGDGPSADVPARETPEINAPETETPETAAPASDATDTPSDADVPANAEPAAAPDQVTIDHRGTGTVVRFPTPNGMVSEEEFAVLRSLGFKGSRDRKQPRFFYLPSNMTLSRREDKVRRLKELLDGQNVAYQAPEEDTEKPQLSEEQLEQLRGHYYAPAGTWALTDFRPGDGVWTGHHWDTVDSIGPKNLRLQSRGSTPFDGVLARRRGGEIRTMFDEPADDGTPRPGATDPNTMRDEQIAAELEQLRGATLPEGNDPTSRTVRRQVAARIHALTGAQSERDFARRRDESARRALAALVRDPGRSAAKKGEQIQGRDGAPIGIVYQEQKGKWLFVDRDGRTPTSERYKTRAGAITALNKLTDARNERAGEGWKHSAWDDVQPGDTVRVPELGRQEDSRRRVVTGWSEPLEVSEIRRGDMGQVLISGRRGDEDVELEVPRTDATFGTAKPGTVPDREPSDAGGGMDWRQMRPDDFGQEEPPAAAADPNTPRPVDEFGTPDLLANGTPDNPGDENEDRNAADNATAPDAPIRETSPADMTDEDIKTELEELQAWQNRHVASTGEGPRIQGSAMLALSPVGDRRGHLWGEQRKREAARQDREKREKEKQERAEALARAEIGKRTDDGSYPVTVDGEEAGTVRQLGRQWLYQRVNEPSGPLEHSSRANAVAALVRNIDVRREMDQARSSEAARRTEQEARAAAAAQPVYGPAYSHELRARMGDIGDDIATLQNREGLQDPERIQRLQDLIQRVSRGETDDLQGDLRRIRDEAAWLESQFDDPDLDLPYETRRSRSWATAARMKAERDLRYPDFQNTDGDADGPDTGGSSDDDRPGRAQGLFGEGMNAVGGESLPEMQELADRLGRADAADDRDAELRDIADRMDALAEQYELAGPQGELAADRFRQAARFARGESDGNDTSSAGVPADSGRDPNAVGAPTADAARFTNVDEIRNRWRRGELDEPSHPSAVPEERFRDRYVDNPSLELSEGGRLAIVHDTSRDPGASWEILAPGSMEPVAMAFDRDDALAYARVLEGVRDAEGRPFPWDAPDAAERALAFRGPEGDSLGETVARQIIERGSTEGVGDFWQKKARLYLDRERQLDGYYDSWRAQQEADGYTLPVEVNDAQPGDDVTSLNAGQSDRPVTLRGQLRGPLRAQHLVRTGTWPFTNGTDYNAPTERNVVETDPAREENATRKTPFSSFSFRNTPDRPMAFRRTRPGEEERNEGEESPRGNNRSEDSEGSGAGSRDIDEADESTPADNEQQDDDRDNRNDDRQDTEEGQRRRDGDLAGGAADPDGEPGEGGPGTPEAPGGSDNSDDEQGAPAADDDGKDDEERRRRRRRRNRDGGGNGGPGEGGPGLPHLNLADSSAPSPTGEGGGEDTGNGNDTRARHRDVDSLRNAWRTGDGLTPAEDTPERRALLSALADREGLALSPEAGLATYPEPQADGSTVWRFAQARNGTNLPGTTLTSNDPEEAQALAGRFDEISDRNGDPFDWHAAWGPASVAAWRDGEGRNLPQALRVVQDDYEQERTGAFTLPEDLTDLSDPDLEAAALQGLGPEDTLRVMAEMDRRDGYADERIRAAVPETPPATAEEAEREGQAMDAALGFGDTDVTRPAPAEPGRLRREFDSLDEERFQSATDATGGRFLSPKAEADGVDLREVFSGRKYSNKQARELASPELNLWLFGDDTQPGNGRLTYAQYRQRETDRVLRAEFADMDEARYRAAVEYTNGYFFKRQYKYAALGFNERELFSGGSLSARDRWREYASEELVNWYDANGGRLTFNQYKQQHRENNRTDRDLFEAQQNQAAEDGETTRPFTAADVEPAPPIDAPRPESIEEAAPRYGGADRIYGFADRAELRPDGSGGAQAVWLDGRRIGTVAVHTAEPGQAPVWDARPFFGLGDGHASRAQDRDLAVANLVVQALQDGPADPTNPGDDAWDSVMQHLAVGSRPMPELPEALRDTPEARTRYDRLTTLVEAFRDGRSPSGDLRDDLVQAREDFTWLRAATGEREQPDVLADLDARAAWAGRLLDGFTSDSSRERPRNDDGQQQDAADVPSPTPPADGPAPDPENTDGPAQNPEPQQAPDPIDGRPAYWARVEDLVPGDMVRMNGTTRRGKPIQRAGYVYEGPERVDVTRRGRTEQMWRTWVTDNPDGTGVGRNVYTSANGTAARADAPDDVVPGSPASGAQAALRSGDLPNEIPADRNGRALFPGSAVTDTGDREGTVTGATDTTVSVHWSDGGDDTALSPTTLSVTDGQRPDGWTADGRRVMAQSVVSDADGALLGPVDDVDGDSVTITTADGTISRSAGDLRVTGEVRDDAPDTAPVTGVDEPAAADLEEGDVVLLDLDGHLATVSITSPPSRDGDRVALQYADTTTGEIGEIDVDARAVLPRAQGPDGNAPDLGPDDAPKPDDDMTVHPTPHPVGPVTGPTVDPNLDSSDRNVIGDRADGPDDDPAAHQAAVRITADLPVTREQAAALATQLRAAADPSTLEGRAALRAADHLDRAAGRTPSAGLDRPRPSNAAQIGEGDLVAMPDERQGDQVRVFRVIDAEDGPGGLRSFLLEDENQQWRRRVVHGAMPVWQLPEAEPDPVTPPDADNTTPTPDASTPNVPAAPSAPPPSPVPDEPSLPVARDTPGSLRVGDVIDAPVSRTGYTFNGHRRLTIISEPQRNGWWMQLTGVDEDGNVHDFGLHSGRAVNIYDRNRPTPALPPAGAHRDPNQVTQADVDRIVTAHARSTAARIIDEAVAGTQPPGNIHALREQIAQRLTAEALRDARQAVRRDGAAALDAAGITGRDRVAAQRRLRNTRGQAHSDTVRAALRTINDLEPLPNESDEDLAARVRDLLRLIPDQVARRPLTDPNANPDVAGAVRGHANDAVNALMQQLQAAGVDPGDAERIARILTQQMARSRQATARRIAARIAAANPDAGRQPGLLARIVALLIRMAKRLAELVKAGARRIAEKYRSSRERMRRLRAFLGRMVGRVRQWPESRRLARLHRAVNLPDADGNSLAARVSHWAGLMPEPGRFGQSQRRVTFWRPTTWGQLAAGRLPDRSDRIQWTPDRAADGGPGLTALRHMAALRAAGSDVDQDVTRRLSAALGDDFGDDPHATLQHADDYVADSERRVVNLQAARSGATIPDDPDLEIEIDTARTELASARREYANLRTRYAAAVPDAVAAALADIRDMGPAGDNAIVFGPDTDPDAERAVRGVQRLVPRAWLNIPQARRLTAVNGDQGRYEPDAQRITVADLADEGMGTAGHALAQHFARHLGDLDAAQRAFWFSRTHTGRPGARRMRLSALDRLLRRQLTQPETGDSLARSVQAMFSGDWYQDDDLRAFLLGLMATR